MLTPNTGKKPWRLPEKPEEVDFPGSQPQKAGGRLPGMNSKKILIRIFSFQAADTGSWKEVPIPQGFTLL